MVVPPLLCSLWSTLHLFGLEFADVPVDDYLKVGGAIVALTTIWIGWRSHEEKAMFEMIDKLYSLCHALQAHVLTQWQLGHLFAISSGEYQRIRALIESSVTDQNRGELLVKERFFAIHIYIVYEQIYFQWRKTPSWLHPRRAKFLKDVLGYFTCRLLTNPRLRALRVAHPGGHVLHLESESAKYLDQCMGPEDANAYQDQEGPFLDHSAPDKQKAAPDDAAFRKTN